jgi:gliding motility-associated-like protein
LCSGDTTYAQLFLKGGSQTYAFSWNPSIYLVGDFVGSKKAIVPLDNVYYNIIAWDLACPNYTVLTSFSVNVNKAPLPNFNIKTRGCSPLTQVYDPNTWDKTFVTTLDFGGNLKYQFSDSASQVPITIATPGTYSLIAYTKAKKSFGGCSGVYQFPFPITVDPKPGTDILWLPENPTTNDEITFTPANLNGKITSRFWQFLGGDPTIIDTSMKTRLSKDTTSTMHPIRKYTTVGRYPISLIATTDLGCTDTVVRFLTIADDFRVYIPNTFTPNNDGINDVFQIKGSGIKADGFIMEIKDRWGNTVYTTKEITDAWDGKVNGKEAELGTYVCRVKVTGARGEGRKEYVGMVNIVR